MRIALPARKSLLQSCILSVALLAPLASPAAQHRAARPLSFTNSDINPKNVFWIQGRFVPVDDPKLQADPQVETILCLSRELECLLIEGSPVLSHGEQVWVQEFKVMSWENEGIVAASRSLDGCTDETLKIRFAQPSAVLINSPVLPMSTGCKKANNAWDTLAGKKGSTLRAQMDQEMLVPTRGPFPWTDLNLPEEKH